MKHKQSTALRPWQIRRRSLLASALGALALPFAPSPGRAQDGPYPNRPVRIIVPFGAGSSPDARARVLADSLSSQMGQRFIVENRAGAGTTLGSTAVAETRADGYTLLATLSPALQTGPLLYRSARYNALTSFTPVGSFSRASPFLVVSATQALRTVQDLIALAGATHGGLPMAYSGPGGVTHLPAELLRQTAGAEFLYVPYKSEVDSLQDLLAHRVVAAHYYGALAVPQVQAGRLRALAHAGAQRSSALPDVPTLAEAGFPGVEFQVVMLLLGPAGLPEEIVDRLSKALQVATQDAGLQSQFELTGSQTVFATPGQTAAALRRDAAMAGQLIRQLRIVPG